MKLNIRFVHTLVVAALAATGGLYVPTPALAGTSLPGGLVSYAPTYGATPNVHDVTANRETIAAYAEAGPHAFYGGYALSASPPGGKPQACGHFLWQTFTRTRSGTTPPPSTLSCNIKFNGSIEALAVSPDKRFLYVGGRFSQVRVGNKPFNRTGVAKISIAGRTVTSDFRPSLCAFPGKPREVLDLSFTHGQLLIAGNFACIGTTNRAGVVSVRPSDGALTNYINLRVGGKFNGSTGVAKVALSPTGTKAMMIGEFTTVAGARRYRAAMLNLGRTSATLSRWYSPRLEQKCGDRTLEYIRDADFSPGGSRLTLASGGGASRVGSLCDMVARYAVDDNPNAVPLWQRDAGSLQNPDGTTAGDTIWSVEDAGSVVYASGHEKGWTRRFKDDRLVEVRKDVASGISALDPNSGQMLPWEAGRDRGEGGRELVAVPATSYHPAGLIVGSDTFYWYRKGWRNIPNRADQLGYLRGCVAFLPVA